MGDYNKNSQFDKEINWKGKIKLCKLFQKTDKNQQVYFMGELNKSNYLVVQKNTASWAKEGEWTATIVPVTYKKKQMDQQQPQSFGDKSNEFSSNVEGGFGY